VKTNGSVKLGRAVHDGTTGGTGKGWVGSKGKKKTQKTDSPRPTLTEARPKKKKGKLRQDARKVKAGARNPREGALTLFLPQGVRQVCKGTKIEKEEKSSM